MGLGGGAAWGRQQINRGGPQYGCGEKHINIEEGAVVCDGRAIPGLFLLCCCRLVRRTASYACVWVMTSAEG